MLFTHVAVINISILIMDQLTLYLKESTFKKPQRIIMQFPFALPFFTSMFWYSVSFSPLSSVTIFLAEKTFKALRVQQQETAENCHMLVNILYHSFLKLTV